MPCERIGKAQSAIKSLEPVDQPPAVSKNKGRVSMLEALVAFAQLSGAGLAVTPPAQPITAGYAAGINATSSETFQAEKARRSGGASVNDRYAGYTGSGYVETHGSSGITWTVSVPTSGTYSLKIPLRRGHRQPVRHAWPSITRRRNP